MQYNKIREKPEQNSMGVFLVNQTTQLTEPRGVQTAIRPYHPLDFCIAESNSNKQTTKQSSTETKQNDENTSLSDKIYSEIYFGNPFRAWFPLISLALEII